MKQGGVVVCIASMSAHMCSASKPITDLLTNPLAPDLLNNISNLPGKPLADSGVAYAYAKRGLIDYVAKIASNWGQDGLRMMTIFPGVIDTEMGRLELENQQNSDDMLNTIPLGRLGQPEDIAQTAFFLLSEKASYITGCDVLVDGGFIAALKNR